MMNKIARGVFGVALLAGLQSCQTFEKWFGTNDNETAANSVNNEENWNNYQDSQNPNTTDYSDCGTGNDQSPIDFTNVTSRAFPNITFNYDETNFTTENTGNFFQFNTDDAGGFEWNGETYELEYVQFHTPSEHTFDGRHFNAEMQFFHKNSNGDFAVISVPFRRGDHNTTFDGFWNNLPMGINETFTNNDNVNAETFFPKNRDFFWYEGSFTTPPCNDGVQWFVFQNPNTMSSAQVDAFRDIFRNNNRPVQPTGNRTVWFGTTN